MDWICYPSRFRIRSINSGLAIPVATKCTVPARAVRISTPASDNNFQIGLLGFVTIQNFKALNLRLYRITLGIFFPISYKWHRRSQTRGRGPVLRSLALSWLQNRGDKAFCGIRKDGFFLRREFGKTPKIMREFGKLDSRRERENGILASGIWENAKNIAGFWNFHSLPGPGKHRLLERKRC